MIDVLNTAQLILRSAGFNTRLVNGTGAATLYFEDTTLMGFGCAFDSPATLLSQWRTTENALLAKNAASLRAAGEKAWNVYLLLFTQERGDASETRQVQWIEEDLQYTRKLAACALATREDVIQALLPLLPIQLQPLLQQGDLTERLQRRIRSIAPRAANIALNENAPPEDVVRIFGEPT
jgi:hypothetical protein